MKALFELFRRFDARRIFGFIRRLGGMSRPKVKCYDLRSTHALRVEGDLDKITWGDTSKVFLSTPFGWRVTFHTLYYNKYYLFLSTPSGWRATAKTDKVFVCFCAKGRKICLFKTRKEKNLPVAF